GARGRADLAGGGARRAGPARGGRAWVRRSGPQAPSDDHRQVLRRAGGRQQPGRGDSRREGRHRGHLRAVSHPGRVPRSHAAGPCRHRARLRISGAQTPEEGCQSVVTAAPRTVCRARIASLATYVPPRLLTNADLEKMVETSDEWIVQRTGIRSRHIAEPGVGTSELATKAALLAIERA